MVAQVSEGKIQLGGLFDGLRVQVDQYEKLISDFSKLDLNTNKKYWTIDGKADWEAIAKAIGTTDARAIGYFKTLDNGKGTIDNSSASVEGMSVYLKKTGQAFDFAALKASLLNAALNASIMIAFTVAIKAVQYAWDQANTTVAEVQERIDDLTDSISSLETEYNNLKDAGSENLTDAEQARLQYLEDRIEREKELKELEEARLIREKYGNGFTDYFDEDNYNQKYNKFKEEYFGGYHNNDVAALDVGIKTEKQNVIDMGSSLDEYLESQEKLKQYIEQMNNHEHGDNSYEMAKSLYDKEIKKSEDLLSKVQEEYQNYKTVQYEAQNEIDSMKADLENPNLTKTDKDNIQAMIDKYQQMIDIANYFVDQMRDIPGVPLDTDTDTYYNWFNKLSDDEKDLTHSEEFKQALEEQKEGLNGAALSAENYDAALQSIQSTQDDTTESISKTKSGMIDAINELSDGFDVLDKIYADIKDGDVFDFTNLDSKKFTEAFSGLEDEYTEFIEKVSSSPNDIKGCQDAFDNLVSAWINSKGILKDLTEENANVAESMLKNMGISNAEEIIQQYLGVIQEITNAGYDLENITEDEATAFLHQAEASDVAKQYLTNYLIQKQLAQQPLNTSADILALENLCDKLGVTGEMYKYVTGLKSAFAAVDAGAPLAAYQNQIDSYKEKIADLSSAGTVNFKFNYSGGDSSNKTSKSGSSSKNYETELKKQLESIKTEYEKGSITLDEYYEKSLSLIKQYYDEGKIEASDFYDNNKSLLDDYLKYLEIAYKRGSMSYGEYFAKYLKAVQDCYDKGAISTEEYWNYNKELLDDYVDSAKKILDNLYDHKSMQAAGVSDLKQYLTTCYEMIKSFYNQGKISAYDYYNYLSDFYDYQISIYDKVIDAVTNKLDDQIDALEKQKDQIEKNYNAQIDVLEKEKDALEAENDVRQDAIDLQKALYEMNRAQNQRTDLVYKDGQMVYTADQQGIRDKKNELDDLEYQQKIKEIEKQISSLEETMDSLTDGIDQQIEDLNNYKDQWEDVKNKFIEQQNELLAEQIIGKDWEIDIQNMRMEALVDFTNKYIAMQQAQADAAVAAANKIVEAQRNIAAMQDTTSVSVGSVQEVTPYDNSKSSTKKSSSNKQSVSGGNQKTYNIRTNLSDDHPSKKKKQKPYAINGNRWYAEGTDNAEKGWHIVSEDNIGDEIVIDNNGNAVIPHGEQLYNFQGGEQVIPANESKEIIENQGNIEKIPDKVVLGDGTVLTPVSYVMEISDSIRQSMMKNVAFPDNVGQRNYENLMKNANNISNVNNNQPTDNSISIGEIHLHEVQNVDELTKGIIHKLPGKMRQALYSR